MLYYIVRFIAGMFLHIKCRIKIIGRENIPKEGGVIICSNHMDFFDPILIAVATKRPIHFMGKKELFKNPIGKFFFEHINAFPVDRNTTDMKSYKQALTLLKDGNVMGIFAQGTRMKDADVKSAKSGTAMFSLKSGATVVPTGISGSYKWFSKINIEFGEPLSFEEYASKKIKHDTLDEVTDIIIKNINGILSRY